MASLFDIKKVTVGEDKLTAHVAVNPDMPTMTSEDIEATARVYYLAPGIAKHLCLGDAGNEFQDCMGDTEMAHLLEHLSVEIMNQTGLAGKIACGRTRASEEERVWDVELSCPDDALTIGALSSATFMMDWAFLAPDQPAPDFDGTVTALKQLVLSLRPQDSENVQGESASEEPADQPAAEDAAAAAAESVPADEPAVSDGSFADPRAEAAEERSDVAPAIDPEEAAAAVEDAATTPVVGREPAGAEPASVPASVEASPSSPLVSPAVFDEDEGASAQPGQDADQA